MGAHEGAWGSYSGCMAAAWASGRLHWAAWGCMVAAWARMEVHGGCMRGACGPPRAHPDPAAHGRGPETRAAAPRNAAPHRPPPRPQALRSSCCSPSGAWVGRLGGRVEGGWWDQRRPGWGRRRPARREAGAAQRPGPRRTAARARGAAPAARPPTAVRSARPPLLAPRRNNAAFTRCAPHGVRPARLAASRRRRRRRGRAGRGAAGRSRGAGWRRSCAASHRPGVARRGGGYWRAAGAI
jgi:hypothetical protein